MAHKLSIGRRTKLTKKNVLLRETFKIEVAEGYLSEFDNLTSVLQVEKTKPTEDLLGNNGIPVMSYTERNVAFTGSRRSAKFFAENGFKVVRGVYDLQL